MKERLGKISRRIWIILAVLLGAAILAYLFFGRARANTTTAFQTSKVERGTLTATVVPGMRARQRSARGSPERWAVKVRWAIRS
jgi:hypothetical protein